MKTATAPAATSGAFNTGRLYTVNGQRIAWKVLPSGHVAMWDRDRIVDYVLRIDGPPTNAKVLAAYDGVSSSNPDRRDVPYNAADYRAAADLRAELHEAADKVAPIPPPCTPRVRS